MNFFNINLSKRNSQKFFYKLILFLLIINFQFLYSNEISEIKVREDAEIINLENEIKLLEQKVKNLKLQKSNKRKEDIKIGLALSGGGAKGYAHLGVLKILEKENIKIDYITGTSIGALIGTLYSIGYEINKIEEILDRLNLDNFWRTGSNISDLSIEKKESLKKYSFYISYDENFNYSLPKGLRDTQSMYLEIKKLLNNYKNFDDTEKLPIPIKIITTNLNTGEAKAFGHGDIAQILTASMAVPALLEPVIINGTPYVDGLISRNLPVQDAYDMGADIVIASDIGTEVTNKSDYNILSILNQLIAIQSSHITKESRNKASILITPDLKNITALDTSKKNELIELGIKAAEEKIEDLHKFSISRKNDVSKTSHLPSTFLIQRIEYSENFSKSMRETFDEIFKDFLNSEVSNRDIEKKINKIYNLKYADELYYTVKNNTLYINGETGHLNTVGVGLSYRSNYGSTINLGTDMYFNGKFGNIINFNLKFGDYLGLDLGTYSYYGRSNKVGVFTRFGYNESPYYFYKDYKKVAKFLSKELFLNFGIFTQPNTKTMLSYGISSKIVNFDTDTGSIEAKEFEYSGNINKTYLRFKYDTLDSLTVPMQGLKADLIYNFSNSFGNLNTSVYGPSYYLKGYKSLGKNSSLLYGLSTAVIRGENIKADQYIKLGGVYNNIENNEFEFYGFNFHEKSIKEFLSMSIGLRHKLFYSTYLTAKFNMATFGNEGNLTSEKLKMLKNFSKGMGLSLIYDSPIGPVEFTVSDTFKKRKPIATFSIGYKLD